MTFRRFDLALEYISYICYLINVIAWFIY